MPQLSIPRGAGEIIVRKKASVTITLKEGPKEIQAYVTVSPFLFVHHPYKFNGEGLCTDPKSGWKVTHGPTGLSCGPPFDRLKQALAYAEVFAEGARKLNFADTKDVDMVALGKVHDVARRHAITL